MLYFKFHESGILADLSETPMDGYLEGDFESMVLHRYKIDKDGKVYDDFIGFSDDELDDEIIRRIDARNKLTESAQP